MRMRQRVPFEGLRLQFGISIGSATNYYSECLDSFHAHVVPRLLYPLDAADIDATTPAAFAADLPGCKVIFDLTGFAKRGKENVLLSRILYSAYHHESELGALFGMHVLDVGYVFVLIAFLFRSDTKWIIYFSVQTFWWDIK